MDDERGSFMGGHKKNNLLLRQQIPLNIDISLFKCENIHRKRWS